MNQFFVLKDGKLLDGRIALEFQTGEIPEVEKPVRLVLNDASIFILPPDHDARVYFEDFWFKHVTASDKQISDFSLDAFLARSGL